MIQAMQGCKNPLHFIVHPLDRVPLTQGPLMRGVQLEDRAHARPRYLPPPCCPDVSFLGPVMQ